MSAFTVEVRRALHARRPARLRNPKRPSAAPFGRAFAFISLVYGVLTLPLAADAQAQLSVPPAYFPPQRAGPSSVIELRTSPNATRRTIHLPAPAASEYARLKAAAAASDPYGKTRKSRGLAIGFARNVPSAEGTIRLADLAWQTLPDGARASRIELTSPGAAALRVEVALDKPVAGLTLRFKGSGAGRIHAYPAAAILRHRAFWTPVLEGESVTMELEIAPGAPRIDAVLSLPMISHLGAPNTSSSSLSSYIGAAQACEVDVACMTPAFLNQIGTATNAVARIVVTVSGTTYLCSGTLLNDSTGSFTPYVLTANHCVTGLIDTTGPEDIPAAAAETVNTYWFFQAASCGNRDVPDYTLIADGATLLARSVDFDWSLLRLNGPPPGGATFAAWNAAGPLTPGTGVAAIHHPEGDLKKISQGNVLGYSQYADGSSFIESRWSSGATEPGSSGGGLFSLDPANANFELRGSLAGGSGTCSASGFDEFSRFDAAFPLTQEYLAPDAPNPVKTTSVTEFYSPNSGDYLITADPREVNALDVDLAQGWVRTGLRFLAFTDPAAAPLAVQPVCRLRLANENSDERLYSASPQECATILANYGNAWKLENAAAFYAALPDATTGACPPLTRPVYRFASVADGTRRRYTAEVDVRDSVIRRGGWTQEGFGSPPDQVAMCVPAAGPTAVGPTQTGTNYEGLWWAAPAGSESGWGLSIAHQGDTIFLGWFTYDADGNPWWLSMSAAKTTPGSYSGLLVQTSGPPFNAVPFDPNAVVRTSVGAATLTFRDAFNGTFSYAVKGAAQSRAITRVAFGVLPTCTYEPAPDLAAATNYQDVWFVPGGAESGWGLMLTHQGDVVFAAWYTYDQTGSPLWISASASKVGPNQYSGTLIRSTGPPFNAIPFDSARVTRDTIGTMTLIFTDGNQATFTYSIDGLTQSKALTRLLFAPPAATICR